MFLDLNLISPIRETNSTQGAKRRREEREKTQKVLPRRDNHGSPHEDPAEREKGRGLNAYA